MRKLAGIGIFLLCFVSPVLSQQSYFISTTSHGKQWQMYGSAVCGNFLYIMGGETIDLGYTTLVKKSRINPDGTLGPWTETTPLPQKRSYIDNSTIVLNDIVYMVSGFDGVKETRFNTILWAKPGPDGELGQWNESIPYPGEPVNCAVAFATPGHIYLVGGRTNSALPTGDVWCATVQQDGAIREWKKGPQLPEALWYHCGGVAGGSAWIWGGLTTPKSTAVSRAVYKAPILASGEIGIWGSYPVTPPMGFYSAPTTVCGSYLISFCPRYSGAVISGDVWFTQVTSQGLAGWNKFPANIPTKLYIGLATDYRRGTIYIPGGRISKEQIYDSKVYFMKVAGFEQQPGKPGQPKPDFFIIDEVPGSQAQNLSFLVQTGAGTGAFPGFLPFDSARQISTARKKPMVLYAYTQIAREAKEQNEIIKNLNISAYSARIVFAELDVSQFPQLAQQIGIFKVPCWIVYNEAGQITSQSNSLLQKPEIESLLNRIAP